MGEGVGLETIVGMGVVVDVTVCVGCGVCVGTDVIILVDVSNCSACVSDIESKFVSLMLQALVMMRIRKMGKKRVMIISPGLVFHWPR